jgi:ATP-dependent helicase/nuclease subunit B
MARRLERYALRGIAPAPGFAGIVEALEENASRHDNADRRARIEGLTGWLGRIAAAAEPFAKLIDSPLVSLEETLTAHVAFAEWLAASDEASGPARLWAGDAGEAAARFVAELRPAAAGLRPFAGTDYAPLLADLMAGVVVRPRYGGHPRLAIWGPLEARLQQVDRLVLAGLNEGTWPAEPVTDPWLSRPMRAAFGLPPPERRVGLAAHDFAQGFAAPEVVLTRALRVEGAPTVPSRWLLRLDGFLGVLQHDIATEAPRWRAWQQQLDRPAAIAGIGPPAPKPPVAARPRKLPVTAIETWMRDPYAIYARHVLELRALDPLGEDLGPAERGLFIHQALDLFVTEIGDGWPADPLARLLDAGRRAFGQALQRPTVRAFWWPRFERIARWFVGTEAGQRADLLARHAEVRGEFVLPAAGGDFTVTAKADRIDRLRAGGLAIIDYKTGTPPPNKDIALGFAPQLPLEAAMAAAGGFAGIDHAAVERLEHWWLGSDPKVVPIAAPAAAAQQAREGLLRLIDAFDDPATAYASQPAAQYAPRHSDYEHLARVKEWSTQLADEELPP